MTRIVALSVLFIAAVFAAAPAADEPAEDICQKTVELEEAFGRGDIKMILAELSPNVDWSQQNMAFSVTGRYQGITQALELFGRLAKAGHVTKELHPVALHCDKVRNAVMITVDSGMQNYVTGKTGEYSEQHLVQWMSGKAVSVRAFHKNSESKDSMVGLATPDAEELVEQLLAAWFAVDHEKANSLLRGHKPLKFAGASYVPGRGEYATWEEMWEKVLFDWDFEIHSYKPLISVMDACVMEFKFNRLVYYPSGGSMLTDDSTRLYIRALSNKAGTHLTSVEFVINPDPRRLTYITRPPTRGKSDEKHGLLGRLKSKFDL